MTPAELVLVVVLIVENIALLGAGFFSYTTE